jgi:hypothetical protein
MNAPSAGLAYETIDPVALQALTEQHAWITAPIERASDHLLTLPFFDWVQSIRSPMDFRPAALQLWHHSATFPKVMGLMLGLTSMSENHMMPFYAKHAFGEADHNQLLMNWMLRHGLLNDAAEIEEVIPSVETNACVNIAYQIALEQDRQKWLVTINSGIERCSNHLFKVVAQKMHEIGAGHEYFDVHVEADEHHSIMGLEHMKPEDPHSRRGKALIAKALEGITLWGAMLHSWIGAPQIPHFRLDGSRLQTSGSSRVQPACA